MMPLSKVGVFKVTVHACLQSYVLCKFAAGILGEPEVDGEEDRTAVTTVMDAAMDLEPVTDIVWLVDLVLVTLVVYDVEAVGQPEPDLVAVMEPLDDGLRVMVLSTDLDELAETVAIGAFLEREGATLLVDCMVRV